MSDVTLHCDHHIATITLNRIEKYNAFDDAMLKALQQAINSAIENPMIRVMLLKANGPHFCAGADLAWMQKMAHFTEEDNIKDAMILGSLMQTLYQCPKPTIAAVQGRAFGGGVGLVAACDIAIAASDAVFCFSEVKLGLIPAVISPYIIEAIGSRQAKYLFMTAMPFEAPKALSLGLITDCVHKDNLTSTADHLAQTIAHLAPEAVKDCKSLVQQIRHEPITSDLTQTTAKLIANKRASDEGQRGLRAFLEKKTPSWN